MFLEFFGLIIAPFEEVTVDLLGDFMEICFL